MFASRDQHHDMLARGISTGTRGKAMRSVLPCLSRQGKWTRRNVEFDLLSITSAFCKMNAWLGKWRKRYQICVWAERKRERCVFAGLSLGRFADISRSSYYGLRPGRLNQSTEMLLANQEENTFAFHQVPWFSTGLVWEERATLWEVKWE